MDLGVPTLCVWSPSVLATLSRTTFIEAVAEMQQTHVCVRMAEKEMGDCRHVMADKSRLSR